jgi:hypothetical protein
MFSRNLNEGSWPYGRTVSLKFLVVGVKTVSGRGGNTHEKKIIQPTLTKRR